MKTAANNPKASPPDECGLASDAAPMIKSSPATAQPIAPMGGLVRFGSV
jgi:hypothetical protein